MSLRDAVPPPWDTMPLSVAVPLRGTAGKHSPSAERDADHTGKGITSAGRGATSTGMGRVPPPAVPQGSAWCCMRVPVGSAAQGKPVLLPVGVALAEGRVPAGPRERADAAAAVGVAAGQDGTNTISEDADDAPLHTPARPPTPPHPAVRRAWRWCQCM